MQQLSTITKRPNTGGRVSSQELRASFDTEEGYEGLTSKVDRYYLLKLVERVGKGAGFTPRMVDLLSYYLRFTRETDWEEGSRPIVYQSLSKTALDFGISERQIQKLENALFETGALTWHDSGNHRRFGQRCPKTGKILYAYGVELTPLAELEERLTELLDEKEAHARAWMETKRQVSFYRRQIKALTAEAQEMSSICPEAIKEIEEHYQTIAVQIRTHISLPRLQELLAKHRELFLQTKELVEEGDKIAPPCVSTEESASTSEEKFAHYNATNQFPSNKFDTGRASPNRLARGIGREDRDPKTTEVNEESQQVQRRGRLPQPSPSQEESSQNSEAGQITLNQVVNASSSRFREHLPARSSSTSEHDLIEAAYQMREQLQISKGSWSRACGAMGRMGAAICLLLTDQAALRQVQPVRVPGAYFNAMVTRSQKGELHLKRSIFAQLKREEGALA